MPSNPTLPVDRLTIGQLLVRLLHHFRTEMFDEGRHDDRFGDLRFPHLQIWSNVGVEGIRLTDLADKANLSLAACSELVNELETLGYLERRPDPTDGRAKLIFPTERGRLLLAEAGRAVAELEQRWREQLPEGNFDRACRDLDTLLDALEEGRRSS